MNDSALIQHIRILNGCNQRGGRMLSMIDLLDAGSIDTGLAAYLTAVMQRGVSLLVGANPGGAGKTAVMCACLNLVPDSMTLRVADNLPLQTQPPSPENKHTCYLAHEIGAGSYYAYVWGQKARDFFALTSKGFAIASNLHADTLEQLQDQLCRQNNISQELVDAVSIKIFLGVQRSFRSGMHRWISHVYENDGQGDVLLWERKDDGTFMRITSSQLVDNTQEEMWGYFISSCQKRGIRKIEDVRRVLLSFLG